MAARGPDAESAGAKTAAVWVPIATLRPWAKNPRRNDAAVTAVVESIRRFGFGAPLLVRRANGEVIAGHTRLRAAIRLGLDSVPIRLLDLDEHEAHALALADNRTGEIAQWDDEMLGRVLGELKGLDVSLDGLGFSKDELRALISREDLTDDDGSTEPLPLPPDEEADSQPGEVYEFGPHRLVCGDSTSPEAWAALLPGGERCQSVWTDPPYGVAYEGKSGLAAGKAGKKVLNDDVDEARLESLLRGSLGATVSHSQPGSPVYVAAPAGPMFLVFERVLRELGVWKQTLTWAKSHFVLGRSDYHYQHEAIFYGSTPGATRWWCGRRDLASILHADKPHRSVDHPTMKPVSLVRQCLENSSEPGWIIGDPFGGSGTTLIASACTGRVARLVELSPGYCDVIRRRWTRWARANGRDPGVGALDG